MPVSFCRATFGGNINWNVPLEKVIIPKLNFIAIHEKQNSGNLRTKKKVILNDSGITREESSPKTLNDFSDVFTAAPLEKRCNFVMYTQHFWLLYNQEQVWRAWDQDIVIPDPSWTWNVPAIEPISIIGYNSGYNSKYTDTCSHPMLVCIDQHRYLGR